MPALAVQASPPSTLSDVLRQVRDAFDAMGNMTPVHVGRQYLDRLGSADPCVLFVPEPSGSWGPSREMGAAASVTHSCDVYVRGAESGDDFTKFDNAYALADLVLSCLVTAATGRIDGGKFEDDSAADVDSFGADVHFAFTYQRDVWHSAARRALAAATDDSGGAVPAVPPGTPGTVDSVLTTTEPVEET